jgi:multidrug resistance efflux pump
MLTALVVPFHLTSSGHAVATSGPDTSNPPAQDSYQVKAGPLVHSVYRECELHHRDVVQIYARQDGFVVGNVAADALVEADASLASFEADPALDTLPDLRARQQLAETRRRILMSTVVPAEQTILKNQLAALEQRIRDLQRRETRARDLLASGDISEDRYRQVTAELQSALDEADSVASTGAIKSAGSDLQLAELDAELAQLAGSIRRQEDISRNQIIRSDQAGQIVFADARLLTGRPSFVRRGELLFTLAFSDALEASAKFDAEDIWLVRDATVIVSQLNGLSSATGRVEQIVRSEHLGPASATEHIVSVALAGGTLDFDALRRTECRFDRVVSDAALTIPLAYLDEHDGAHTVIRRVHNKLVSTTVLLGQSGQGTVEITSGLNPGDQIVLPRARS